MRLLLLQLVAADGDKGGEEVVGRRVSERKDSRDSDTAEDIWLYG